MSGGNASYSLTVKFAIGAVLAVLVLSLLSRMSESSIRKYSPKFIKHVKNLVRYSSQWSTLAKQDQNPLMSLLHINTALSYAYVAKKLVPTKDIDRIANVNMDELIYLLEEEQMQAVQSVGEICPDLQPEGLFAVYTGWVA